MTIVLWLYVAETFVLLNCFLLGAVFVIPRSWEVCMCVCVCTSPAHVSQVVWPSNPFWGESVWITSWGVVFSMSFLRRGSLVPQGSGVFFKTWIMDGFDIFFQFSYLHDLHGQRCVFTSRGTKFWSNPDCWNHFHIWCSLFTCAMFFTGLLSCAALLWWWPSNLGCRTARGAAMGCAGSQGFNCMMMCCDDV